MLASPDAAQHGVTIRKELPDQPLGVKVDTDFMKQAVLNIVLNGVQSMPEGGSLTISAKRRGDLIETEIRRGSQTTRILFSGDVGRYDAPLYHDPTPPPACQYLICESTYGNREHPDQPVQSIDPLLLVEAEQHLGITARSEPQAPPLQLFAQLDVDEDNVVRLPEPMSTTSAYCPYPGEGPSICRGGPVRNEGESRTLDMVVE
jgi:hypothetical protein